MAALQCDICGGSLTMAEGGDFAACDSCGMKYDKRRVQQKIQEIRGSVKIEGSVQVDGLANIDNLLVRAIRFYNEGNYPKAIEYCEKVLDIDVDNEKAIGIIKDIEQIKELTTRWNRLASGAQSFMEGGTNAKSAEESYQYLIQHPNTIEKFIETFGGNIDLVLFFVYKEDSKRAIACINKIHAINPNIALNPKYCGGEMYYTAFKKVLENEDLFSAFKMCISKIDRSFIHKCLRLNCVSGVELYLKLGGNPNGEIDTISSGYKSYYKYTKNPQIKALLKQYGAKTGVFG